MRRTTLILFGTVAAVAAVAVIALRPDGPDAVVVFDGQSMNVTPSPDTAFPALVMEDREASWANVAIIGAPWTGLAASAQERSFARVDPSARNVLVMCGGYSDILFEHDTGQRLYADEVAYAEAARSAGFDRVIITTLPSSVSFDRQQDEQRRSHNEMLLEDPADAFDAVVDVTRGPLDDPTSTELYIDGTHWTGAGAQLVADAIGPALDEALDEGLL